MKKYDLVKKRQKLSIKIEKKLKKDARLLTIRRNI